MMRQAIPFALGSVAAVVVAILGTSGDWSESTTYGVVLGCAVVLAATGPIYAFGSRQPDLLPNTWMTALTVSVLLAATAAASIYVEATAPSRRRRYRSQVSIDPDNQIPIVLVEDVANPTTSDRRDRSVDFAVTPKGPRLTESSAVAVRLVVPLDYPLDTLQDTMASEWRRERRAMWWRAPLRQV
jgi:hypothetical protein